MQTPLKGTPPFTVKDLLDKIDEHLRDKSITMDTPIIYSHDDEGNDIQGVVYMPAVMYVTEPISKGQRGLEDLVIAAADLEYEAKDSVLPVLCIN